MLSILSVLIIFYGPQLPETPRRNLLSCAWKEPVGLVPHTILRVRRGSIVDVRPPDILRVYG
jgi:hypothetical protein